MTLPENTKGVLLDVDDTLVDTRGAFAHAMGAIADEYFPHLPGERHGDVLAMWRADRNGFYRAYTQGRLSEQQQRRARAEELHAAFGGPMITDRLYAEWEELFMVAFAAGWAPFPEVDAVLADFAERGLAVGAVTNANQSMQTRKLRACGLDDVPLLVTLDTFGVGKPDPRVFLEATRLLGLSAENTVYVGDELDIDAHGAQRAGLTGVWLDRPGTRRGGSHAEGRDRAVALGVSVISSLDELRTDPGR